jgi:centractin
LVTSAELEVVRQIKETCCYVAYNPQKEEEVKSNPAPRSYELPDGSRIDVSASLSLPPSPLSLTLPLPAARR